MLVARISAPDVRAREMTFRQTVERVTTNMIELDADVTRQLLDASTGLAGETETAWADASERLTRLWQGQLALHRVVEQIDALRAGRQSVPPRVLESIVDLLDGPSVELPAPPDNGRRLTSASATETWMVEAALQSLSADYEAVMDVVAAVAGVWGDATERMKALAIKLPDVGRLAGELDLGLSNELVATKRALEEAEDTARTDPLAFDPKVVEALSSRVRQARHIVEEAEHQRAAAAQGCDAFEAKCDEAAALLAECDTAFRRLEERIVIPASAWAKLDGDRAELERLRHESRMARHSSGVRSLHRLGNRLGALLLDLGRAGDFAASCLERRDEMRGLLEAYRAKAQAFGMEEHPEIDAQYTTLRQVLYTAPCDLTASETLLTDYRRAIGQSRERRS